MLLTLWVTLLSMLLIVGLERFACRIRSSPLAAWQRWLIPLPLILLVGWNLDEVFNLQAWLETHPNGFPIRYTKNHAARDSIPFAGAAVICAVLIPFTLSNTFRKMGCIVPVFWCGYFLWNFFVLIPLMLGTGFPFKQD